MNITAIISPIYYLFTLLAISDNSQDGMVILYNLRGSINNSYVDDYYDNYDNYYYEDDDYDYYYNYDYSYRNGDEDLLQF
tara:strand:+ start:22 stop:261 length:240 start_codon:yes stop_codon:yes gene_type:complete